MNPFIMIPLVFVGIIFADITKELLKTACKLCREMHEYDT